MNKMEIKRKYILRIHGTLLMLVGIAASINATLGVRYGMGSYTFLQNNEVGYIGLLQAYLLAVLTGIVLWTGSYLDNRKKWNRIGSLFHFFILIVYALYWNFFTTLPGGENYKKCRLWLSHYLFHNRIMGWSSYKKY